MSLNIEKLKSRLNALSNNNNQQQTRANLIWKPSKEDQTIRIVPYKFSLDYPFIELKFYFNLNGRTYLSPDSFGHPDPIKECAITLASTGDPKDKELSLKLKPSQRIYVPILIRGHEYEGIKFWGFSPSVFRVLGDYFANEEYGDLSDLQTGTDIMVRFIPKEESSTKKYPETKITPKRSSSVAFDPADEKLNEIFKNQPNILDLFKEPTYDELKKALDLWLNPENEEEEMGEAHVLNKSINIDSKSIASQEDIQDNQFKDMFGID